MTLRNPVEQDDVSDLIDNLDPDLEALLVDRGVDVMLQAKLAQLGVRTVRVFLQRSS